MRGKRIVSLFVGTLATLAGWMFLFWSYEVLRDLRSPEVSKVGSLLGGIFMLTLAGLSWFEAYRFLKYFFVRSDPKSNR
jgi:hypothetical protein